MQINPYTQVDTGQMPNYDSPLAEPTEMQGSPYGMLPPMYGQNNGSEIGIIKELSPKKVLEQLRMNLKGFYFDTDKKEYVKIPGMEPLMNDKGIAKYLSVMGSVITDLVTFSNYQASEINQLTLYVCEKVIPTIHINYKEYGIKEKSDLQILDVQIFNLTLASFKKGLGSGDRNVIRGVISESIANSPIYPEESPGGGFLAKLNPFRKRHGY